MSEVSGKIYLQLVVGTLFWGINFHLAQIATSYLSPMGASAGRYVFASIGILILYPFIAHRKVDEKMLRRSLRSALPIIAVCLSGVFFFNYYFFKGLSMTYALNGALIVGLNPIFTLLIAIPLVGVALRRMQLLGIAVSLVGVAVVITRGNLWNLAATEVNMGDFYILVACILFALHNVLIQKYLSWLNPVLLTLLTTVLGTILFVVFSIPEFMTVGLTSLDAPFWWSVVVMGFAGTSLSFTFWNSGVKEIGAGNTALFINLVPIFAALSGLAFDKPITAFQVGGGILIGLGIWMANRKTRYM